LLLIGAVAKIFTSYFCKKIYLLHNAKTTMLIILYFLFLITAVSLDSIFKTNLIDIDIFTTVFSLFPIVFIIIVTDKVFNEGFKIFNWGWVLSFSEFLVISFVVRGLLNRIWLKHLLLSYPEIIILILILNIFIWRFTGLQVLEYFRFMPMISRHLDGEEEE
jgi:ABC-type multidrug transport system permease subunit